MQKYRDQDLFIGEDLSLDICLLRCMLALQPCKLTICVLVEVLMAYIILNFFLVLFWLQHPRLQIFRCSFQTVTPFDHNTTAGRVKNPYFDT